MTLPDPVFSLSRIERNDPLFIKLRTYYEKRLEQLRAENDNEADAEKTAAIRGRIKEVKLFLFLDREKPVVD